jgi:hypothetical protein
MRERDPQFLSTIPEVDDEDEEESGLGYSQYACRVLYKHNCRSCPRFSCGKRTSRSRYQE